MKPANPNKTITQCDRRGWQVATTWTGGLLQRVLRHRRSHTATTPMSLRRVDPLLTAWWMATDHRAAHSLALHRERRDRQRTRLRGR